MPESVHEVMISALRNVHALEGQAIQILERQKSRLKDFPELQARVAQHLDESKAQQDRLEHVLRRFDEGTSAVKGAVMGVTGNLQAMMHAMAEDEVLKNTFASYAFEHFEIASYRSLIRIAEVAEQSEVVDVCEENLAEEMAMAEWLEDHIEQVTGEYLMKQGHATTGVPQASV